MDIDGRMHACMWMTMEGWLCSFLFLPFPHPWRANCSSNGALSRAEKKAITAACMQWRTTTGRRHACMHAVRSGGSAAPAAAFAAALKGAPSARGCVHLRRRHLHRQGYGGLAGGACTGVSCIVRRRLHRVHAGCGTCGSTAAPELDDDAPARRDTRCMMDGCMHACMQMHGWVDGWMDGMHA